MEMLKASDIAPQLGLTSGRVYQLIQKGVIPSVKCGRSVRIPKRDWEKWLAKQNQIAIARRVSRS